MNKLRASIIRTMSANKRSLSSFDVKSLKNTELFRTQSYVNGKWISSSETFSVENPATGEHIGDVPDHTVDDFKKAITEANESFKKYKKTTNRERATFLRRWADLIKENVDDLAAIVTWENGKPLKEAKAEVMATYSNIEWFSEEAPRIYGDTIPSADPSKRIHTIKQPIGVCGIITPWNFPSSMISRKVGAAVATGCTSVIKPAAETPFSALALAYLAEKAGIPAGVINVLTAHTNLKDISNEICTNNLVRKVTFTGSTTVGKILMKQSAENMKKVSFELGGNAPVIVFDDADIDQAVEQSIATKFRGSGQTCICANRFFVHEKVYDEFASKLTEKVKKFTVGSGFDDTTDQGPLISQKSIEKVSSHVEDAISKKGEVLTGGKKLSDIGDNFYAPTVIKGCTTDMKIFNEEIFGPVAAIAKFSSEEEVINAANDSEVGLAGYFFTKDVSRAHRVAEAMEVGMVGLNTGAITESALPFGGVKQSGIGRENSKYGVDDYLVIKSVITAV